MTAIALTPEQETLALTVAKEIGDAVRKARHLSGETMLELAARIQMPHTTLSKLERGEEVNAKLGNIMRVLNASGLAIIIAPKQSTSRADSVSSLVDRILTLRGGEDLLRHHLKRRGLMLARGDAQ